MPSKRYPNILDIIAHILIVVFLSPIIYLKFHQISYVIFFAAGSILIDLDHLVDYFLYYKSKFNLQDFLNSSYLKSGRVYIFLHSWEIIFGLFILGTISKRLELLILVLGATIHLFIDNLQRKNIFSYFLIYRIIKKFQVKVLLPEFSDSQSYDTR